MEIITSKSNSKGIENDPNKIFSKRNVYALCNNVGEELVSNLILDLSEKRSSNDFFSNCEVNFHDILIDLSNILDEIYNGYDGHVITEKKIRIMYTAIILTLKITNDEILKTVVKNTLLEYFKEIL